MSSPPINGLNRTGTDKDKTANDERSKQCRGIWFMRDSRERWKSERRASDWIRKERSTAVGEIEKDVRFVREHEPLRCVEP